MEMMMEKRSTIGEVEKRGRSKVVGLSLSGAGAVAMGVLLVGYAAAMVALMTYPLWGM